MGEPIQYNALVFREPTILPVLADVLDHIDALVATVGAVLTVLIAWVDMRSRVKEAHRRLTEHDEKLSRLDGEMDVLRTEHVKALADIKITMAEIKADVKIVRARVSDGEHKSNPKP